MKYEQTKHKIKLLWSQINKSKNIIKRLVKFIGNPIARSQTFKSIINLYDSDWIKAEVEVFQDDSVSIAEQDIGTKTYWQVRNGL